MELMSDGGYTGVSGVELGADWEAGAEGDNPRPERKDLENGGFAVRMPLQRQDIEQTLTTPMYAWDELRFRFRTPLHEL